MENDQSYQLQQLMNREEQGSILMLSTVGEYNSLTKADSEEMIH